MAPIPETRYAETTEGAVAYQVVGDGPIDVIVHNSNLFPIDLMWDEPHLVSYLNRLSTFCRHIWFDSYGTGASDWIPRTAGRAMESRVSAAVAVLDDLECERPAVLGLSDPAGLLFAATHPERSRALVLVNGFASVRRTDDHPEGLSDEIVQQRLQRIQRAPTSSTEVSFLAPSLGRDEHFVRWLNRARRLARSPADFRWANSFFYKSDLRGVLPAVRVPTLVVARQDLPRFMRGRYLADHIEGARRVEIPGDDFLFFAGDTGAMLDAIEEFLTGRLPTPDTDRVLATVVFTDVVDSTGHAARLGDRRWRQVLTDHDGLVRRELERFHGREVKTTGDGFLATFDGPGRAVRCACAIRDGVRTLGIEIRVGIHTGEIELRGDDVGGIGVHVAQRVQGSADPGEVLVSETVPRLVVGSEIEFEDRGEHELKGVPGRWRLFAAEV